MFNIFKYKKPPRQCWHILGESVQGAAHVRGGLPNQDAIRMWRSDDNDFPIILSIADGHGSASNFRSDVGSRLAVKAAVSVCREFAARVGDSAVLESVNLLPKMIVKRWQAYVLEHYIDEPFTKEELLGLKGKLTEKKLRRVVLDQKMAYGTTSLTTMIINPFIIHIQLGDGDILEVSDDGTVTRPIPEDDRLIANETTSMCQSDAEINFDVTVRNLNSRPTALVMLSTDGYANSFKQNEGFLKVGADLLDMIKKHGIPYVKDQLNIWLQETSESGSGDDITLGIIAKLDAPPAPKEASMSEPSPKENEPEDFNNDEQPGI